MCLLCSCLSICIRADGWFENLEGKVLNNEKKMHYCLFLSAKILQKVALLALMKESIYTLQGRRKV